MRHADGNGAVSVKPLVVAALAAFAAAPLLNAGAKPAAAVEGVYARVGQEALRVELKQVNPFGAASALPRATADRSDDISTAQIHVIYAVPNDQPDRALDTDGTIASSVGAIQAWLRSQTGGPGLRIDTYQGEPDITFVQLSQPDAAYSSASNIYEAVFDELRQTYHDPNKAYLVYYEGSAPSGDPSMAICGMGSAGGFSGGLVFLRQGCPYDLAWSRAGNAGVLEFVALHELIHAMGFVPNCAPHAKWGHVYDSPDDLMSPYMTLHVPILDVNHDDYFDAHIPDCPDLSGSRFIEGGGSSLTVSVADSGGRGTVTSSSGDVRCPDECVATADSWVASTVELSVDPDPGSTFRGWSGACTGTVPTCAVSLSGAQTVKATFGAAAPPLKYVPRARPAVTAAGSAAAG
jgi:Divergent InlB B-repeat domain